MEESYDAVVIGSGFGGAINACRLAKKWPGKKVLVLERGKPYPMGSFPRSPHDFARNFWCRSEETVQRPSGIRKLIEKTGQDVHGMFDVRNYEHMDVVICAGLGGGSLIYANVFLIPPDEVFDARWPKSCKKQNLTPYYQIAKEVLGARPIPRNGNARRDILKTKFFEEAAKKAARKSELVDINVFFGNDFQNPLPIGHQQENRYGALQTSCVYCGECIIGCNYHAKNTLDLNYLYAAKNYHLAEIRTEHLSEKIVPVNENREDDVSADGSNGFRVYFRDLRQSSAGKGAVFADRVVVSAGALGSTELLLRAKQETLPRISDKLGCSFSGNGDFLSFVLGSRRPADPNYGPTITQRVDFNLFEHFDRNHAFILEGASYPTALAWFIEGIKPGFLRIPALWRFLRHIYGRWVTGKSPGTIGYALSDILSGDLSYGTSVLLWMGLDESNGVMRLDGNRNLVLDWPYRDSLPLYRGILAAGRAFRGAVEGDTVFPLSTWEWPVRKNITVHPLGGCALAEGPSKGVTSADRRSFGQVFGYEGLYVADGSILPSAVGSNPVATISALAEMVAEGITGIQPTADLRARA